MQGRLGSRPIRWPLALSGTAPCSIGSAGLAPMGGTGAGSEHICACSQGRLHLSACGNFKRGVALDPTEVIGSIQWLDELSRTSLLAIRSAWTLLRRWHRSIYSTSWALYRLVSNERVHSSIRSDATRSSDYRLRHPFAIALNLMGLIQWWSDHPMPTFSAWRAPTASSLGGL